MHIWKNHPYWRGILPMAGFSGSGLLLALAAWGLSAAGVIESGFVWIGFIFFAIFFLILVIIWALGVSKIQRAQAFLESERVLARWTYSVAEWQRIKEITWQEEKGDWKVQFGCLTALFAMAGLLTGVMLGVEQGIAGGFISGLAGLVVGSLVGISFGLIVAGSSYWSSRQAYRNPEPGTVALGVNEIYAANDYFRGDGIAEYFRGARLQRQEIDTLELLIARRPRPRMPDEELWVIPVPVHWVERVQEILPVIAPARESSSRMWEAEDS